MEPLEPSEPPGETEDNDVIMEVVRVKTELTVKCENSEKRGRKRNPDTPAVSGGQYHGLLVDAF